MQKFKAEDGWIEWKGGKCPVDDDTKVDVWLHNNFKSTDNYSANTWTWEWDDEVAPHTCDIVAYRLHKEQTKDAPTPVKSNGGSSAYYALTITNKNGKSIDCETGDVIAALVGDGFQLGNVVKAVRRIYECSQGRGKDGVTMEYDVNKIKYFLDDFLLRYSK